MRNEEQQSVIKDVLDLVEISLQETEAELSKLNVQPRTGQLTGMELPELPTNQGDEYIQKSLKLWIKWQAALDLKFAAEHYARQYLR